VENSSTIEHNRDSAPAKDRWLRILIVSILLNLISMVLFPMFLTDGLTLRLALIAGVPAASGSYVFFFFRTKRERFVGYASVASAVVWLAVIVHLISAYGWAGI